MTENLLAQIDALLDSDLVEASGYYLVDTLGVQSADEVEEMLSKYCEELGADLIALEVIRNDLIHDRDSYRKLLRFLLREATQESDEQRQHVGEALESTGQKQVVTDLFLIMSLAILTTIQMTLLLYTKGKEKEVKKVDIEKKPDGSIHISMEEETIYTSSSTSLGSFLNWLKSLMKGQN